MSLFKQKKEKTGFFSTIEKALYRFSPFKNKKESYFSRHAIHFLNISQFLGVINDNFFKYLVVFLLIDLQGVTKSPSILTLVGVIYVLPFLLFSSAAGILADRFSKQRMIVTLKWSELVIMLLGIVAFSFKSPWASYSLLFLLSLQSALFSPPKYSIIAELVEVQKIPKANGLITSFTYLGIIVGTFLASFFTQITKKNFPLTAAICTLLATLGLISAIFIPKTIAKQTKRKIKLFFFYEIYTNLRYTKRIPYLLTAIFGSAFFLFIGAYFQLNVIPFAVQAFAMTEVAGGYLFLLTAVGIATGALIAGRLCKHYPEVGLSCLAGMGIAFILFWIGIFPHFLFFVCLEFFLLGIISGMYIVPFDSFVQRFSPDQKRGQIIAAANFLSFCGVLIAPLLLFLFSDSLQLTAAQGFLITSLLVFIAVLSISMRLPRFLFSTIAKYFVKPLYHLSVDNSPLMRQQLFVFYFTQYRLLYFYLLSALNPNLHFYLVRKKRRYIDYVIRRFSPIDFIYASNLKEAASLFKKGAVKEEQKKEIPCLIVHSIPSDEKSAAKAALKEIRESAIIAVEVKKILRQHQLDQKRFIRSKIILRFFLYT